MVCPAGFEPAASGVGVLRSIRMSYGHVNNKTVRVSSKYILYDIYYIIYTWKKNIEKIKN